MKRLLAPALLVLPIGCASAKIAPSVRPSLLAGYAGATAFVSPARWRYHPRRAATMLARVRIGSGWLFAGERGERWQLDRGAEASPYLAPEPLLSIFAPQPGRWTLVGASGTVYETEAPLGPFLRSAAPPDPLVRMSAAGAIVLGVRGDGKLMRSADAGRSWAATGPADQRFADVALLADGSGLGLSVPERWWTSGDSGASWQPANYPPVGGLSVYPDQEQSIVVEGTLGYARWRRQAGAAFVPLTAVPERQHFQVEVRPGRGPDASALSEGRAIVTAGHYYEVSSERQVGGGWQLWQGPVERRLESSGLPVAKSCQATALGGFDHCLVLTCWRRAPTDSADPVELFRSDDRGQSWHPLPVTVWARYSEFELTVGRGGTMVMTGVCAGGDAQRGCQPRGVHYLARASDAPSRSRRPSTATRRELELWPAATPAASGAASALAFSADGETAYAVMPRSKGRAYALYVSRDHGRTFAARELGGVGPANQPNQDGGFPSYSRRRPATTLALAPAEDGSVAVLMRSGEGSRLFVADDDGRVISSSSAPPGANGLGAVGARALAYSTASGEVWESLDGGASWDDLGRLPLTLCPGDSGCRMPVVCYPTGCVIGDELSRIGWRGQADPGQRLLPPPEQRRSELIERRVAVPFSCALAREGWRHVDGAEHMPRAEQAALGKTVWFAPTVDEVTGKSGTVHGIGGSRVQVEKVTLLPPVSQKGGYARHLSLQVEGVAALRYRVATPNDPRLAEVEVGWENLVEGRVRFARLPDGGPYRPGDYESGPAGWQLARPHLLSIATGGIYLRVHASAADAQETWFLDGRTLTKLPPVAWPRTVGGEARTEMVHVDGQHVPVRLVGNGTALVRARWEGKAWTFAAFATGLAEPKRFGLVQEHDIGYLGERAGLEISRHDAQETQHHTWLFPFRAAGAVLDPPIELPTQLDAGSRPRSCSAAQRAATPRAVVPYQAGTRHPVVVVDSTEPQRVMLTSAAVMYGTPREPCVVTLEANQVEPSPGTEGQLEAALLPLDDLEHAWLFRLGPTEPRGSPGFDYRLMSCHFEPALEVPSVVYDAPGTLVPRR